MHRLLKILRSSTKPTVAILSSFVLGAIILFLAGYDVGKAFNALYSATFRNLFAFTGTINRSSPLIFVGLAVAIAFRGSVFNIGAEGQLLMGAVLATIVGITFTTLPGFILIPFMILAGAAGGALWAFIPGFLKARYEVSEVITTIMFNYIALYYIGYLVRGPIRDISQAEPQSFPIARQGFLPSILPGTRLHMGYLLGVLLAFALFYLLFKTYTGYEIRAVGLNRDAARCGGIHVERTITATMLISGAIAGVGGAIELADIHYLIEGISPGHGYTGISVAVLASSNPIGIIFSSFLFGALSSGATTMQRMAGVSASFVGIFQGIMIIAIAVATVVQKPGAVKTVPSGDGGSSNSPDSEESEGRNNK
jgi:general nucleoside transport system permease protein